MSSYSSPQHRSGAGVAAGSPYSGGRGFAGAAGRQIVSPAHQSQAQQAYSPAHSPLARTQAAAGQGYGSPYGTQTPVQGSPYSPRQASSPTASPSDPAAAARAAEAQREIEAAAEEQRAVAEALAANRCICNICTCGKHHCPSLIHGQAHYDPSLQSLYRHTYRRHPLEVSRAVAPPSTVFASGERFEGASVTRSDYVAHVGARPSPLWQPPPAEAVGGEQSLVKESETRANYKAHGYARRSAAIPAHTMHVSNEPFDGQSTTKLDYQRWSAKPPSPIRPSTHAMPTGPDERNFQTEASQHFNSKGFVARQPAIPFNSHVLGHHGEDTGTGESNMKADYRQWDVAPAQSFKREHKPLAPSLLYHA